ncbi:hypothetical protein WJX72_012513 [[Myrmecia] bisecta]|uniref:Kazal-like domain-containing protein n=1 Tax=[Myrmecia] bisecta TaxID=41462 RepID=A0AAW1PL76_9CHLO
MPAKRAAVLTWACLLVTSVLGQDAGRAPPCSRTCRADNCDSLNIKYGKYCGIGYTGCSGPCAPVSSLRLAKKSRAMGSTAAVRSTTAVVHGMA